MGIYAGTGEKRERSPPLSPADVAIATNLTEAEVSRAAPVEISLLMAERPGTRAEQIAASCSRLAKSSRRRKSSPSSTIDAAVKRYASGVIATPIQNGPTIAAVGPSKLED